VVAWSVNYINSWCPYEYPLSVEKHVHQRKGNMSIGNNEAVTERHTTKLYDRHVDKYIKEEVKKELLMNSITRCIRKNSSTRR
jgi:hypothetical protein